MTSQFDGAAPVAAAPSLDVTPVGTFNPTVVLVPMLALTLIAALMYYLKNQRSGRIDSVI